MQTLKVLITVKTYPIPSAKYDELVCTAGVTESGDFIRLYPIRFRDLPYSQQYKKYQWKPQFLEALRQQRLWDDRKATREPPRKVPWKFHYRFECDDSRCNGNHRMMIEDWELGALYWRCIDNGDAPAIAAAKVKDKFLGTMCAPERDTHLFVGTVLEHGTWVVIGVFWPPRDDSDSNSAPLFESSGL